jgi:hypothetical protein
MARVVIDPALPDRASLDNEIARLRGLDVGQLRARWHTAFRRRAPPHLPRHLLFRILAYRLHEATPDGNNSLYCFNFLTHDIQAYAKHHHVLHYPPR